MRRGTQIVLMSQKIDAYKHGFRSVEERLKVRALCKGGDNIEMDLKQVESEKVS